MKEMGAMKHELVWKTLIGGGLKTGLMVLNLLRCVARGGWAIKMGEFGRYVIMEWPYSLSKILFYLAILYTYRMTL